MRTGPIELEEIYLGSFRIELHWDQIDRQRAYEVIATDPNPPDGDDRVTHPHVRDQVLCEGEGATSIKAALSHRRTIACSLRKE